MLQPPRQWTLKELRMETNKLLTAKSSATAVTPNCARWGFRMERSRILAPESWGAFQRNDFSEPSLLHVPTHRKALTSLTWDVWFSLINSNLLMFRLPGLCCKNSYIYWIPAPTPPPTPCLFGAVSQSYLRCYVLGLKSSECPPNKI